MAADGSVIIDTRMDTTGVRNGVSAIKQSFKGLGSAVKKIGLLIGGAFAVGKLVQFGKECVELGLKEVKPWGFLGDMGQAVHDHAFANGYTVVREIGGHGVGLEFHEEPWVGYNTKRGQEMLLVPGMIFTIEPMVNMGKVDIYVDSKNDWEVYTEDGLPSAQWEIMVLVTEDGHEVLCW